MTRISIHVPREGHDVLRHGMGGRGDISIHVPREGHDRCRPDLGRARRNFNPRAPRGARLRRAGRTAEHPISIHVPREGHD